MTVSTQALYNLSPLAGLLLIVALLALVPLLWIGRRHRTVARRVHALRLLTLFLTFDLVLFGAFTRLSDSGLGCPDWPGCYGHTSPISAQPSIAAAQSLLPMGPVTHAKAWIEMLHRYLAATVGALILALTAMSWRDWWQRRTGNMPWLGTATLLWVCLQGAFGALTVTMKLMPAIVSLHLLGALGLLVLLCVQVVHDSDDGMSHPMRPGLRRWLRSCLALLVLQSALGAWVSANYAVLACSDFPTCQGSWWPEMDFQQGFSLWRGLGVTATGEPIDFAALTAIHYVHRLMAYLVLVFLMVLAWQLNRSRTWRLQSRVLAALIGLQLASGLGNVVLGWPLLSALLHSGGAAALVLTLTWTDARVSGIAFAGHYLSVRRSMGRWS